MNNKNEKLAHNAYQQINDRWMRLHLNTLYISTFIAFITEVFMFFVIYYIDNMSSPLELYAWKYTIIPTSTCLILCLIGHYCIQSKKLTSHQKQYVISLLTVCFTFVISIVHNLFSVVLIVLLVPPLLTVLYEDEKLTSITTIMSVICQFLSGFVIVWDTDKVVDSMYVISLFIIFVLSFVIWLISCTMIRFIKMKRKVIIKNEVERYELKRKIRIDGLTMIGNKMALLQKIKIMIHNQKDAYLVMFDIDKFKEINDCYGHVYGDNVLKTVGYVLNESTPRHSSYRYGGDEFCIILEEDKEKVETIIQDIKKVLKTNQEFAITISVGVAKYKKGMTDEEWIVEADRAMYKSKLSEESEISFI